MRSLLLPLGETMVTWTPMGAVDLERALVVSCQHATAGSLGTVSWSEWPLGAA